MNTYVMMIGNEWYAFAGNMRDNQVYSIGKDNPPKTKDLFIPKKPEKIVINTDDLMNGLKSFLETIGCTNVQISSLTPEEIEEKRKNAVEM